MILILGNTFNKCKRIIVIYSSAVTTPSGSFEFLRMPFKLRNAGNTFQRFITKVTRGLDFIFVYLDDAVLTLVKMKLKYLNI